MEHIWHRPSLLFGIREPRNFSPHSVRDKLFNFLHLYPLKLAKGVRSPSLLSSSDAKRQSHGFSQLARHHRSNLGHLHLWGEEESRTQPLRHSEARGRGGHGGEAIRKGGQVMGAN